MKAAQRFIRPRMLARLLNDLTLNISITHLRLALLVMRVTLLSQQKCNRAATPLLQQLLALLRI
jgi:hypothetical protein